MKTNVNYADGRMRAALLGELDHHTARSVIKEIAVRIDAYLPRECVIDMAGVTFMDSSGIAVVLKIYRQMNEIGGRTWIENVPPQPLKVLDASGIERIIRITARA